MSVTYTAVLDVSEDSVLFLSGLLHAERVRRGTRKDTRAVGTYQQAVLALRWLFDDTRMIQLARDNGIGVSTAYDYRDEALTVLAARKPSLHGALLAAKAAGHTHVVVDGTLIYTDRNHTPGPTPGVDWRASHISDSGPNKVRPEMEDHQCERSVGSSLRNSSLKLFGLWSTRRVLSLRLPAR